MGADKEIKALCYTLLSSGGHTCDLSHKGFPLPSMEKLSQQTRLRWHDSTGKDTEIQMIIRPTGHLWGFRNCSRSSRLQVVSCTSLAGTKTNQETAETHPTLAKKPRPQRLKIIEQGFVPQSLPCCSSSLCNPRAGACSWEHTLYNRNKTMVANGAQPATLYFLKYEALIRVFPNYFWGKSIFLSLF